MRRNEVDLLPPPPPFFQQQLFLPFYPYVVVYNLCVSLRVFVMNWSRIA